MECDEISFSLLRADFLGQTPEGDLFDRIPEHLNVDYGDPRPHTHAYGILANSLPTNPVHQVPVLASLSSTNVIYHPQRETSSQTIRCCACGQQLHGNITMSSAGDLVTEIQGTVDIEQSSSLSPDDDKSGANASTSNLAHAPSPHGEQLLAGQIIPQRPYKLRRSGNFSAESIRSVTFSMVDGSGFPLRYALSKNYAGLVQRDKIFAPPTSSVCIRIEWPGYPSWYRQVRTTDWRKPSKPITFAKLATEVAKSLEYFIKKMQDKHIENGYEEWQVGQTRIDIDRLVLNSLHCVSKSSWQAVICLAS